jgi:hypothetical protein
MSSLPRIASSRVRIFSILLVGTASGIAAQLSACGGDNNTQIVGPGLEAGAEGGNTVDGSGTTGGEAGGGDGGVAPTAMQACADSAKARCTRSDMCTNGITNKNKYGDEATCESRLTAQCVKNLDAPGTGASASTVESCAQTLPTEMCAAFLGNDPADTCKPPAGTVANGGACGLSAQCVSTYCAVPAHTGCGTCAAIPAAGDPCGPTGECGARNGLVCVSQQCVAQAGLNQACDKSVPCGPDLNCVGAKGATKGTCQVPVQMMGSTCVPDRLLGPGCDDTLGLYCDPSTKQCVAYAFATDGQPCGELSGGYTICQAGTCIIPDNSGDGGADAGDDAGDGGTTTLKVGTCKALAMENQPCDTDGGPFCMGPSKCIYASDAGTAGTCMLADPSMCK